MQLTLRLMPYWILDTLHIKRKRPNREMIHRQTAKTDALLYGAILEQPLADSQEPGSGCERNSYEALF